MDADFHTEGEHFYKQFSFKMFGLGFVLIDFIKPFCSLFFFCIWLVFGLVCFGLVLLGWRGEAFWGGCPLTKENL